MDPMNPSFWERLGFPLATLILLGFGLLRMANWIKPWVEAVFQDHRDFLKSTSKVLDAMLDEQKAQSQAIQSLARDMVESRKEASAMNATIVDRLEQIADGGRKA